jgi:DNA-binding CsgD family transcriptional regulator
MRTERIVKWLPAGGPGVNDGTRVLVVEDDPDIAAVVSLILTNAGVSAPEVAGILVLTSATAPPPVPPEPEKATIRPSLTRRERAVLELISTGASYAEIGRDLGIEINTVRTHVRSLYDKMGVENRAEAVNLGWALGLLRPGS